MKDQGFGFREDGYPKANERAEALHEVLALEYGINQQSNGRLYRILEAIDAAALRAPRKEQGAVPGPDALLAVAKDICEKLVGNQYHEKDAADIGLFLYNCMTHGVLQPLYASPNGGREERGAALAELVHAAFEEGHIKEPWTPGQKAWLESDSKAALESLRAQPHVEVAAASAPTTVRAMLEAIANYAVDGQPSDHVLAMRAFARRGLEALAP